VLALVIVAASGLAVFAGLEWFARRTPRDDLASRLRWYTLK
jgi:hypothetical protein